MATKTRKKAAQQELAFGLTISGSLRVFRKDKDIEVKGKTISISDFWTNFSRKDDQGNYDNVSLKVMFQRDLDVPENNEVIEIAKSFITITGNKGYERLALMVMEWDYVE